MVDLRTLSIEERRRLAAEAERRARAGATPTEIRAALGISVKAYSSWAKLLGFRQCDLYPDDPRSGARMKHPPGPGGYVRSGRSLLDQPPGPDDGRLVKGEAHPSWRGGRTASRERYNRLRAGRKADAREEVAALGSAMAVLTAVQAALADGDQARAERLVAAWSARKRWLNALQGLESEAGVGPETLDDEADEEELSDADLIEEVFRLTGQRLELAPEKGRGRDQKGEGTKKGAI